MKVGVPKEIKPDEYRVGMTPAGVRELVERGHEVLVERGAGEGSAIHDSEYSAQGAKVVADAPTLFGSVELIVKVKEPQPSEVDLLERRHILFTYLHLAAERTLLRGLVDSGATCIAYETVSDRNGRLPLLAPMSEVAGKLAVHAGARLLEKPFGGSGVLAGGVPGVPAAKVMIVGAGVAGYHAAQVALGLGAEVHVLDRDLNRLRELDRHLTGRYTTTFASKLAVEQLLPEIDVVVGAVLVRGAKAPHVITSEQLELMKHRSVLVDVSIDQGGCFETSRPTTHSAPTYEVQGVTHYCVANIPGAVPVTSTLALTNATLPYVLQLADRGVPAALRSDPGFLAGLNIASGKVTYEPVARDNGIPHSPAGEALLVASGDG